MLETILAQYYDLFLLGLFISIIGLFVVAAIDMKQREAPVRISKILGRLAPQH